MSRRAAGWCALAWLALGLLLSPSSRAQETDFAGTGSAGVGAPGASGPRVAEPPVGELWSWTPTIDAPIVDLSGQVSARAEERLGALLREHRSITGVQLAVLVIDSTAFEPIEDFSLRVAEAWAGGSAERDDGLLVTFAARDRRMRIEVGYGLEAIVPDLVAQGILDGARSLLRAGDWDAAVEHVVMSLVRRTTPPGELPAAARDFVPRPETQAPPPSAGSPSSGLGGVMAVSLMAVVVLGLLGGPGGGSSYGSSGTYRGSSSSTSSWSSSSSGGGYSGGGGSFGGGGASSGW